MLSKFHHMNTWYAKKIVASRELIQGKRWSNSIEKWVNDINPACPKDKEFFIEVGVDVPDYDYLIYQSDNGTYTNPRILFGTEEKKEATRFSKPIYYVQEHHLRLIAKDEELVLKEMMRIKNKEIYFDESFFYEDYTKHLKHIKKANEKNDLQKALRQNNKQD